MSPERVRVAVLANPLLLRSQEEALENVAALDGVTIDHVVVDASQREESSQWRSGAEVVNQGRAVSLADLRLFADVLREEGLKAFVYADSKLGWLLFGETDAMEGLQSRPVEEADVLRDATFHECQPVPDGGAWHTLPDDVTDTMAEECDVAFRFGFGLLRGRILDAPTYGVLSTHGSDITEYRGMGPKIGFMRGDAEAHVTLQQLTDEIDGGRIVHIASRELPDHYSLDDVRRVGRELSTEIYATGIDKLRSPDFEPWEPDELGTYYSHDLQRTDVRFVAKLLAKNNWRRIRKRLPV